MSEPIDPTEPRDPRDPVLPDDETVVAERVVTEQRVADPRDLPPEVVPPHPGGIVVDDPAVEPRVVQQDERVFVGADGAVHRQVDRVEQNPVARRRRPIWPALLIILALALGAIAAAWYFTQTDTSTVPSVVGMPLDDAVTRVESEGFKADIVSEPNDAAQGTVFRQSPSAGSEQDEGSNVQLLVSKGPAQVTLPNGVGISESQARDRMAAAGLQVNVVRIFSEDTEEGDVVAQSPEAGTQAAKGSAVRLNVSKGSAVTTVPSVVGTSQAEATSQVQAAGLTANVVQVPSDQPAGTVVAQNPVGGQAKRGSFVRLNVSSGP